MALGISIQAAAAAGPPRRYIILLHTPVPLGYIKRWRVEAVLANMGGLLALGMLLAMPRPRGALLQEVLGLVGGRLVAR